MKHIKFIFSAILAISPLVIFAHTDNSYELFEDINIYQSDVYNNDDSYFNDNASPFNKKFGLKAADNCAGRLCEACGIGHLNANCECDNVDCDFYGDSCISCDQTEVPGVPIGDAVLPLLFMVFTFASYRIWREKTLKKNITSIIHVV
jgi:hypothetical protein